MKFAILVMGTLALALATASAQNAPMFKVENPPKGYSEVEAVKAYWYSVETIRSEYHIKEPLTPSFTLIFGDKEGVAFEDKQIWLKTWSRPMFEQGVVYLTLAQLATPQNVMRLTKQIEAQQNAKVDVGELKK